MGSRLKENPETTFCWFFEASCPIARDKDPGLLCQFPEDFSDEESLQTLPQFCFPYDIERVRETVAVQHFTFVLTDLEGCQRFGFCRLTSSSRTCLCILSYLPWFEVFYKLLNNLADCLTKGQTNEMRELLSALYKHPVPQAHSSVTLQLGEQLQVRTGVQLSHNHTPLPPGKGESGIPYFIAPDPRSLPSIPESRNLTELVVAVDVSNLLHLYASMLFERRILVTSSKLSTLTACVHACSAILYPMYWQHIYIPVLPPHLLDYCCAPMPYLIGVHSSLMERVRSRALEDVVILNVDTNTMETPFEDLKRVPSDVLSVLKVRLKKQSAAPGSGVARAFLRAQALLFGGYRDALLCPTEGGPIVFCEESFLNHKSHSMREFLESAVHLQFFKQFIDGRLEQMNSGKVPVDLFEEEILQCGESTGGSRSYQQWVGNLKKGGGALILTVKSKANMCKSAKVHAKSSLKNLLSSKEGSESDCLQSRLPITQHFGKSRPRRPARRYGSQQQKELMLEKNNAWRPDWEDGAVDEEEQDSVQVEDDDGEMLPDSEELDLLGEIFDTLSSRSVHERGLLYGTRSLDLFGPDSADYITRREMAAPSQESLSNSFGRSGSLLSWGQEEGPEGQEEGTEEEGPVGQIEQEGLEEQGRGKDRWQRDRPRKHYQEAAAKACDCEQRKEEGAKEEEQDRQEERHDQEGPQEHLEGESQSHNAGATPSLTEPEAAPALTPTPSSEIALGEEPPGARGRVESGSRAWLKGQGLGSTSHVSAGWVAGVEPADLPAPSTGSHLTDPGPEAGEDEGHRPHMPRVRSALVLFQAREGGAWPASALQKPVRSGGNSTKKICPQTPPPDRGHAPAASPPRTPPTGPLPVEVHTDPDTVTEEEEGDLPPVKVSELKKRFEA
ncbi:hypothetical protein AAFF_G00307030 [Aldrovandia affinis]|uniref:UDENN domain-containing protein n=1 Tax=Aldrovandia affinis TaxID=143900 RepID=A0AAD7RAK6_9TELE|nr:hypothetical protein AAFF_G00307030 [Aldrovandia affinis]